MATTTSRLQTAYGARPVHLLAVLGSLALGAYTLSVVGLSALWNPTVWWQSMLVWFLGAVVAHDLLLFPLYAGADRLLPRGRGAATSSESDGPPSKGRPKPSAVNYLRIPDLAVALMFLVFIPGILGQGAATYLSATGQTQGPFLHRWLILSGLAFGLSAVAYAARVILAVRTSAPTNDDRVLPERDGSV